MRNHEDTPAEIAKFFDVDINFLRVENGSIRNFEAEPIISDKSIFIHRKSRSGLQDTIGLAQIPQLSLITALKSFGKFKCDNLRKLTETLGLPAPEVPFMMDYIFDLQKKLNRNFVISTTNSPGQPKFKVKKRYEVLGLNFKSRTQILSYVFS